MKESYVIVCLDKNGMYRQSRDLAEFSTFDDAFLECKIRNKTHGCDFVHIPAKVSNGIHVDFHAIDRKGVIVDV